MPGLPPEIQALADELSQVYAAAQAHIEAELARLVSDPRQWRRTARLRELSATVQRLMDEVDIQASTWLSNEFPKAYNLGAFDGAFGTGDITGWTLVPRDALSAIVTDTFDDLLKATRYVRRTTKQLVRDIAKQAVQDKLVLGQTAMQSGRSISAAMGRDGIHAIRYANGAVHQLDEYAAMVARTKSGVAYNVGTLRGIASGGVSYVEVFDGPGCGWLSHDDSDVANGKILTVDEAEANPLSHPNCRRAFGARPDLTTAAEARQAAPTSANQAALESEAADQAQAALMAQQTAREQRAGRVLAQRDARLQARAAQLAARQGPG